MTDPLAGLSDHDRSVIHAALKAAVDGPFFVWIRRHQTGDPVADAAWKAEHPRHAFTRPGTSLSSEGTEWGEFSPLFGLDHETAVRIVARWPRFDGVSRDDLDLLINNALNNLLCYPHRCEAFWSDFLPVDRRGLHEVFVRWRSTCSRFGPLEQRSGSEFVDALE